MMKAAVLVANDDVRYMDIEEPQVSAGMVKVNVVVSGICGSDIVRVLRNGAHFYPIVLGHEFSGTVTEVGEGVAKVKVGDKVAGVPLVPCMVCNHCQKGDYALCKNYSFIGSRVNGSNAEYVVLPERNVVVLAEAVTFEQGALFEPSSVALHGILQNQFSGGETVAILGGGTVGMFTLQWAKLLGAKSVTVFDISEKRLKLAEKLGADAVINTGEEDFFEQVDQLTHGEGYDYVFETAGITVTMQYAFRLAAPRARVCFIGTPTKTLNFTPEQWENINRKEFYLTGSWMSYSAPFPGREWQMTAEYFADGRLKIEEEFIAERMPMENAGEAFRQFLTPGAVNGKILLVNKNI